MKTVAVIFGGRSTEHDVSILTALASVIKPLELSKKFKVEPVYITKDGRWFWSDELKQLALYQSGEIEQFTAKRRPVTLDINRGLTLIQKSKLFTAKEQKIDVVFPALHGTHGEDGELMGILEAAQVPYVGCGVAASAVAMDKVLSKQVTESAGIANTPWLWFYSRELQSKPSELLERINATLRYPLFVKPAHLGSSIGITRIEKQEDLKNALEVAAHYDNKVIVEQAVQNLIEVTLPIMGNDEPTPALLEQPLVSAEDFFDFDAKYMQGGKKGGKKNGEAGAQGYSNLPADVPKKLYDRAVAVGLDVYRIVGCEGLSRIDMLIDSKTETVYFNEINTLPGDLYKHNWRKAGVPPIELVQKLVTLGEERWQRQQKTTTAFGTNYLKQF